MYRVRWDCENNGIVPDDRTDNKIPLKIMKMTGQQEFCRVLKDPDSGLEIREDIAAQLRQQAELVAKGERGRDFDDVIAELGLE